MSGNYAPRLQRKSTSRRRAQAVAPTMVGDAALQLAPSAYEQAQANPAGLTPAGIMALQRTVGNAAVRRLLRGLPARTEAGAAGTANGQAPVPIQRLIGFEIETRIPLYKNNGGNLEGAKYNTVHANAGTGDASELGVDKDGTNSIIEFVSAPVADDQKSSQFKATAAQWVNVLTGLRNNSNASPPVISLSGQFAGAPVDSYYGFKQGQSKAAINTLAFQATHGLRLDKVPEYLKKTKYKKMPSGSRYAKKQAAVQETAPAMRNFTPLFTARVDPKTVIHKSSDRKKALAEVNGFFSLLAHYLILGGKDIIAYVKNQTMLFYKSKLSDVRNQLVNNNNYAMMLLMAGNVPGLVTDLLGATGRTGAQPVLRNTTVDCATWLTDVLSGTGDQVFEDAKNAWGNPIAPGTVKGRQAIVLEHRDLLNELPPPNELTLANPDAVVKYLVAVFKANKKAQNL